MMAPVPERTDWLDSSRIPAEEVTVDVDVGEEFFLDPQEIEELEKESKSF